MNGLVIFEERSVRDLISFFLEGRFGVITQDAESAEHAIQILSRTETIAILVTDHLEAGKRLIAHSNTERKDIHLICRADPIPPEQTSPSKSLVHFFSDKNLIKNLEGIVLQIFGPFQLQLLDQNQIFCRIRPYLLLSANPLPGDVFVRLSDSKYIKVLREGTEFDLEDLDHFFRKKEFEFLYVKKRKSVLFAHRIQQNLAPHKKKENLARKKPLVKEEKSEINRNRLDFLIAKAEELGKDPDKARLDLLKARKQEELAQQEAQALANAKSLQEKRAAMLQEKASEILNKKLEIERLSAMLHTQRENEKTERQQEEEQKQFLAAEQLEHDLGDELANVHRMASKLGFTQEVQELTKKSVGETIQSIRNTPKVSELLIQLRKNKEQYISVHSMLLAYVSCALASQMEWSSDTTYQKLTLASFLHDITLKNQELAELQTLEELAEKQTKFSNSDLQAYREHPILAAEIARRFTDIPPDVDSIIVQHHERPDGSGFPRGMTHLRIGPLATVFIVSHDLVCYLLKNEGKEEKKNEMNLLKFIERSSKFYQIGNFRKVFSRVRKLKT